MYAVRLIEKKRDGGKLSPEEIDFLVEGFLQGTVPDYQMAALAMAIVCRGMDLDETAALTQSMLKSGGVLPRLGDGAVRVDKHSTGGVGDKVSLVLAPLLAACDLQVPMISGRGLGTSGGTLDKLESVPGVRTDLSADEIAIVLGRAGCVIAGPTEDLVPADRKLYALRDVTGTVPSIGLITASILSKKLAESLDALVLDVKWGSGAFMRHREDAAALGRTMTAVGRRLGLPTHATLSRMDQPLGRMAGNAVEVREAIESLQGGGPPELGELCLALGSRLLVQVRRAANLEEARRELSARLDSGQAMERFECMVAAQGGNLGLLPAAAPTPSAGEMCADLAGFVAAIDTAALGAAVVELGGGRRQMADRIDPTVGLEMLVRLGDPVRPGQPLLRLFASTPSRSASERQTLTRSASERAPPTPPTSEGSESGFAAARRLASRAVVIQDAPPNIGPLWEDCPAE
jgi:pyrimidine-nucleoside phosphorylase/thymidine phosphorylase